MTDIEISKALALAIGYLPVDVRIYSTIDDMPLVRRQAGALSTWRIFDYRDWNVIGPIAEKYNAFAMRSSKGTWSASTEQGNWADGLDTPQKAMAMAVIGDEE